MIKKEDPYSYLDFLRGWTREENREYQQIPNSLLKNYYSNHDVPNKPSARIINLSGFLNEELSVNLYESLGLGFSFRDVLEKFASKKSLEGLKMLEKLTIKKLSKNFSR